MRSAQANPIMKRHFVNIWEQELAGMGIPFERQELGNEVVTDGWNIWPEFRAGPVKTFSVRVFHLDTGCAQQSSGGLCGRRVHQE